MSIRRESKVDNYEYKGAEDVLSSEGSYRSHPGEIEVMPDTKQSHPRRRSRRHSHNKHKSDTDRHGPKRRRFERYEDDGDDSTIENSEKDMVHIPNPIKASLKVDLKTLQEIIFEIGKKSEECKEALNHVLTTAIDRNFRTHKGGRESMNDVTSPYFTRSVNMNKGIEF